MGGEGAVETLNRLISYSLVVNFENKNEIC